jgi:hypothetical protein
MDREIVDQDGRLGASHPDGQRPHLRGAFAPMLWIVGVIRGHRNRVLLIIMEPDGTLARK